MMKNKMELNELSKVTGGITSEQAYEAALKHAKTNRNAATLKKNKLDYDDGVKKYEVEFLVGTTEYEYDIDANTGKVLGFEMESIFD
ncbi:MAG: PepSY domain-containing protein [Lachnospiraceae bacterium]|nr:PepSY domain-containing protein [Lachnospiraceae bacterium]